MRAVSTGMEAEHLNPATTIEAAPDAGCHGGRPPGGRRAHRRRTAPPIGVTVDDARSIASTLPRSYEALVRDRVKFRVGRIVYAAFSRDETVMGFAFPRDEREAPRGALPVGDAGGATVEPPRSAKPPG